MSIDYILKYVGTVFVSDVFLDLEKACYSVLQFTR